MIVRSALISIIGALAAAGGQSVSALTVQEGGEALPTAAEDAPEAAPPRLPILDQRSNEVDYDIHARLEMVEGKAPKLIGSETIRWTNHSGDSVSDLWFHLYLNAFSNNRSTHLIERGDSLGDRSGSKPADENWWGWQRVGSIRVDGVDVTESFRYRSPDSWRKAAEGEGPVREDDRTVFSVHLSRPVPDGATAVIELEWTSRLPRVRRRTGYKEDFLMAAQWFPKIGVYEGGRGWNCHQFHARSEFYADYGTYSVTLDLPREYHKKVGGTGTTAKDYLVGDDRVEVIFEAPSPSDRVRADRFGLYPRVHDFAWTADPDFKVSTYKFSFHKWAERFPEEVAKVQAIFGEDVDLELRDVNVTVLMQPEHKGLADRHFEATAHTLFFYGLWFGEYPYEHITVVDPAWGGRAAGGMEYPTLFTVGCRLGTRPYQHSPEGLVIHEAGHQFWYGLVGNNEFEAAWLDEGFNSYADSEVLMRAYGERIAAQTYFRFPHQGARPASLPGGTRLGEAITGKDWWVVGSGEGTVDKVLRTLNALVAQPIPASDFTDWWRDQPLLTLVPRESDPRWNDRNEYLRGPDSDPTDKPAWEYVDYRSYRVNSYQGTAVKLRTLAGLVGYDAFLRGMRSHAQAWRYRHPYPDDFFAAFNEGAGVDMTWYFEDAFRSVKTIDWSVQVEERKVADPDGWFQNETGEFVRLREDDEDAPEAPGDLVADPKRIQSIADVTLRRRGEFCMPLPWRVEYEYLGTEENEPPREPKLFIWTREQQLASPWMKYTEELPNGWVVRSVVLDPDRVLYVDLDMSDNQWFREVDEVAPLRWAERVLSQYQHLLHWYGGIGG